MSTVGLAEQKSTKFVKCVSLVDHFVISERGRKFWPTSSRSNLSLFVDQLVGKSSTIHADWAGRSKRSKFFFVRRVWSKEIGQSQFQFVSSKSCFYLVSLFICLHVWCMGVTPRTSLESLPSNMRQLYPVPKKEGDGLHTLHPRTRGQFE